MVKKSIFWSLEIEEERQDFEPSCDCWKIQLNNLAQLMARFYEAVTPRHQKSRISAVVSEQTNISLKEDDADGNERAQLPAA